MSGPVRAARRSTLFGVPHSLYTGKTRAFLRKQGIPFVERTPADPRFTAEIVPVVGRAVVPVVVTPDGTVIQDTADILDHFERTGVPATAFLPGPRQRVLAHVAELYAVVSLTRHAMHYRWSFLDQQRAFLLDAFATGARDGEAEAVMARMQAYLPMLGVTAETAPAIEASFLTLLDRLQAHFACHPYLFGGQPSVGDYGLFGPLFAHLGRDPVPATLMRQRAPRVARWVERMNACDPDIPEFGDYQPAFLPDDAVPETLRPVFRLMADELFPELTDALAWLAAFVAERPPVPGAAVVDRPHRRILGTVDTRFHGVPMSSGVQPYIFYLWQRVTDAADALAPADRERVGDWLADAGLATLLTARRPIRFERRGHVERWGERLPAP